MPKSYLITGGSRSGKSRYAQELAADAKCPFYIATGWAGDEEMADRIRQHQADRGEHWQTIERKTDIAGAMQQAVAEGTDFIVVDCLTLWVSNLMMEKVDIDEAVKNTLSAIPASVTTVIVTNELGSGIVPDNRLSREYRDTAGFVNQAFAAAVDHVVLTVSGIPMKIK